MEEGQRGEDADLLSVSNSNSYCDSVWQVCITFWIHNLVLVNDVSSIWDLR